MPKLFVKAHFRKNKKGKKVAVRRHKRAMIKRKPKKTVNNNPFVQKKVPIRLADMTEGSALLTGIKDGPIMTGLIDSDDGRYQFGQVYKELPRNKVPMVVLKKTPFDVDVAPKDDIVKVDSKMVHVYKFNPITEEMEFAEERRKR